MQSDTYLQQKTIEQNKASASIEHKIISPNSLIISTTVVHRKKNKPQVKAASASEEKLTRSGFIRNCVCMCAHMSVCMHTHTHTHTHTYRVVDNNATLLTLISSSILVSFCSRSDALCDCFSIVSSWAIVNSVWEREKKMFKERKFHNHTHAKKVTTASQLLYHLLKSYHASNDNKIQSRCPTTEENKRMKTKIT